MDVERITELVDEAKGIVILLENDLYVQRYDATTISVVKAIHHLLKDIQVTLE